jgi:hypothetical protein
MQPKIASRRDPGRVHLSSTMPDSTGMTSTNDSEPTQTTTTTNPEAASGCCGGAAPTGSSACCALDAKVKESGGTGCGCGTKPSSAPRKGCC